MRDGERVAQSIGLGPEAPDGYTGASLDWRAPDSTRLFFTVETRAGRYRAEAPLRLPTELKHAEIQTIVGEAGVLAVGLVGRHGNASNGWACDFAFTACRLPTSGVPECSPVRLVAQGHTCPSADKPEEHSWLRGDAPGRVQMLGEPVSWDARSFRALPGPLPADAANGWEQATRVTFSRLHGMTGVNLVTGPDERRHRMILKTSAGCFSDGRSVTPVDGFPPATSSVSFVLDKQILGDILLVTWSWGVGILDPPDSEYVACRHAFMVCAVDGSHRPLCSERITVAKAKRCRTDAKYELSYHVPPANPSPGGSGFTIEGHHFEIERPTK